MKPWIVLACAALCRCSAAPPPAPPPPIVVPVPSPAPVDHAPVARVVKAYRAVERRELPKITADNVTADYVQRIHAADIAARHALATLERQDGKATPDALARARTAVNDLAAALDATP